MQALVYFIVIPFIYLLSALPFPLLYAFSSFLYFILFHLIGYRKKVVLQNLHNAFPHKTDEEINAICRAYYRHLCDLFLETFKTLTISKEKMVRHCHFTPEAAILLEKLAADDKSAMIVMGHMGNWEWAGNTFSIQCRHQLFVIYHPIANKYFDKMMYGMRTRFGTKLIPMKNTFKEMLCRKCGLSMTAFIADQTPQPDNAHWLTFLHQDTPVFKGTEIIARKLDIPVIYASVKKVKRGYYEVHAEMLCENPANTTDNELTEMHTKRLEQDIIAQPETWLWSHRRWKHKRPVCINTPVTSIAS